MKLNGAPTLRPTHVHFRSYAFFLCIIINGLLICTFVGVLIRSTKFAFESGKGSGKTPRAIHKLSAIQVSKIKKKGRYGDGGGLYLRVSPAITKSWVFRFVRNGRATEIGLGPFPTINLGEARSEAEICRKQVYQGLNPKLERQRSRRGLKTFGEVADEYLATMGGRWTNQKTVHQWKTTLTNFCEPIGGTM